MGSMDVDLALDAATLNDGRSAEMVKLLLDTKRYRPGEKEFKLVVEVDLKDDENPVQMEVEFLAPKGVKLKKHTPKLLADFRVLQNGPNCSLSLRPCPAWAVSASSRACESGPRTGAG